MGSKWIVELTYRSGMLSDCWIVDSEEEAREEVRKLVGENGCMVSYYPVDEGSVRPYEGPDLDEQAREFNND